MDYYKKLKLLRFPKYRSELFSLCKMRLLRTLSTTIRKKLFSGKTHYCPVCKSFIRGFLDFGCIQKAWCPVCVSMSWHRLSWLFLQQKTNLFNESPKKMLHIAPETGLAPRFKDIANLDYLAADLQSQHCLIKMDITDIQYPDLSFDVIYCSHVLEHIPDDRKAIRELERVLKPNGWALLMVPITVGRTIEDPLETNPAERERRFGRHDHVRCYGLDFGKSLEEEGFKVDVVFTTQLASRDDIHRMGLHEHGAVFFCRKIKQSSHLYDMDTHGYAYNGSIK